MSSTDLVGGVRSARVGGLRTIPYLLPLLLALVLTSVVPVAYAFYLSFFNWNWGRRFSFVGLENYVALIHNGNFWAAMARTGVFTVLAVSLELVLGLALAVAVDNVSRGVGWLRTALIIPLMVSGMVVSLIWKVMLDPTLGIIPWFLARLGFTSIDFLGDPTRALPTVSVLDSWWQTGFVFIILNAGLAALPKEPFEAAAMDGASAWQRFRYVALPLLRPLIFTVAGIRAVDCLKVFALVFGTTDGGPGRATETTQTLAYRTAFKEFAISESMTMMLVYALLIVFGVGLIFVMKRVVHRER